MKNLLLSMLTLGALTVPAASYSMLSRVGQRVSRPRLRAYNSGQRRLSSGLGAYRLRPRLGTYNLGKRGLTTRLKKNSQQELDSALKSYSASSLFAGASLGALATSILQAYKQYENDENELIMYENDENELIMWQKGVQQLKKNQLHSESRLNDYIRTMKELPEGMKAEKKGLQKSIENVKQIIEYIKHMQRTGESLIQQGKNNLQAKKMQVENHLKYLAEDGFTY